MSAIPELRNPQDWEPGDLIYHPEAGWVPIDRIHDDGDSEETWHSDGDRVIREHQEFTRSDIRSEGRSLRFPPGPAWIVVRPEHRKLLCQRAEENLQSLLPMKLTEEALDTTNVIQALDKWMPILESRPALLIDLLCLWGNTLSEVEGLHGPAAGELLYELVTDGAEDILRSSGLPGPHSYYFISRAWQIAGEGNHGFVSFLPPSPGSEEFRFFAAAVLALISASSSRRYKQINFRQSLITFAMWLGNGRSNDWNVTTWKDPSHSWTIAPSYLYNRM